MRHAGLCTSHSLWENDLEMDATGLLFSRMGHDSDRVFCAEQIFKFSYLFWFCFELEGLVILHCVVADGNSTRSPENDDLLCGDPRENCAGNG